MLHISFRGHIAGQKAQLVLGTGGQPLTNGPVGVTERHLPASVGQIKHNAPADASGAAGYQCDAIGLTQNNLRYVRP
jgi:hypothetical protein